MTKVVIFADIFKSIKLANIHQESDKNNYWNFKFFLFGPKIKHSKIDNVTSKIKKNCFQILQVNTSMERVFDTD